MSKQAYWDEYYALPKHKRPFDWLLDYTDVRDLLEARLPATGHFVFLDVGCGTSSFASNVALHNHPRVHTTGFCLDFSQPALLYQRQRHQREVCRRIEHNTTLFRLQPSLFLSHRERHQQIQEGYGRHEGSTCVE